VSANRNKNSPSLLQYLTTIESNVIFMPKKLEVCKLSGIEGNL